MGSFFSLNMEANYKKNQAFIDDMMRTAMERQLQTQNAMMMRQKAMAIAGSRDTFHWLAAFYSVVGTGLISAYRRTKRPALIAPLVPLTFLGAYYWDLAYGTKIDRIRLGAEQVLADERDRLGMPCGLPTPESIEGSLRPSEKKIQENKTE